MNYKLFNAFIAISLLASCTSQENKTEKSDTSSSEVKKEVSPINCYQYSNAGDTIILKTIHAGEAITGTLVYKVKEKDSNKGTIQGSMRGDVLVADYTFMSEGVQSVRQVAFKLEGNSFVEGYGEVVTQNDKVTFKDIGSLEFNGSMKLGEVACE